MVGWEAEAGWYAEAVLEEAVWYTLKESVKICRNVLMISKGETVQLFVFCELGFLKRFSEFCVREPLLEVIDDANH